MGATQIDEGSAREDQHEGRVAHNMNVACLNQPNDVQTAGYGSESVKLRVVDKVAFIEGRRKAPRSPTNERALRPKQPVLKLHRSFSLSFSCHFNYSARIPLLFYLIVHAIDLYDDCNLMSQPHS
jgi:hypothetical protein